MNRLPLCLYLSLATVGSLTASPDLREAYSKPPAEWPPAVVDESEKDRVREIAPLPPPVEVDQARAALGADLFFDPRLSGSRQISCASCHDPEHAWTDGRSLPFGNHRKMLRRNTPALLNAVRQESFFWDGRADSLEDLSLAVMSHPDEMHADPDEVARILSQEPYYQEKFTSVFGEGCITPQHIASALANFVRSIQSRGRARFDQFVGGKQDAMSDQEIVGLHLFRTKAGCMNCHDGPFFNDGRFHDLGLSYYGRSLQDLGRYHITKDPAHSGQFKTPTLRNVTRTAPYMHVGLFPIRGVMNLYNAGMPDLKRKPEQENDELFPVKSPLLRPLELSNEEIEAIIAFLGTLEEPPQRVRAQNFPPLP
jgi:cytochrome c peroxidase